MPGGGRNFNLEYVWKVGSPPRRAFLSRTHCILWPNWVRKEFYLTLGRKIGLHRLAFLLCLAGWFF
jgi:hypothetical protein